MLVSGKYRSSDLNGTNHPDGIRIYFNVPEDNEDKSNYTLKFMNDQAEIIRSFSTNAKKDENKLNIEKGLNHFNWNKISQSG